ncbi:MAG: InlB B-repeat-containing protein [Prevotella sp.]|nr:InlB B-repeat-containing protein [Prevotella sp.]
MKQLTFLKSFFLLCALMIGSSVWAQTLTVDFESSGSTYTTDWEYDKLDFKQTDSNVPPHGGSYFCITKQSSQGQVSYFKTKNKIASPISIVFYVTRKTNNNSTSSWKVEVSENGSTWTQVGDAQDATSMARGTWVEVSRSLSSYSNVYVRISYSGSTAARCIDDVTLTYAPQNYWVATYKYNDGVTSDKEVQVDKTTEASSYVLEAAPSRENFDFLGWNDGTDNYDGGASYPLSSHKTFTAQWVYTGPCTKYNKSTKNDLATGAQYILVGKKSDVNYFAIDDIADNHLYFSGSAVTNANSEITDTKATIVDEVPLVLTLEETTEGWYLKNSTKKLGMTGDKKMNWDAGDMTWELGGSENEPTFSATNSTSNYFLLFNNSTNPPRFNGYTATGTSVANAYFYRLDDGKDVYTLTLDFNDEDATDDGAHRVLEGAAYTLTTPTRSGYAFTGWNTEEDGTGTNYLAGAYTMPAEATTLYAQWSSTVPATITAAEYATFSCAYATDFSTTGITVYTAEDKETSVALNKVDGGQVPANTPVVLYKAGADGTAINVPVIASATAIEGTNDLVVKGDGDDVANMYVLAKPSEKNVGFYLWTGTKLNAGKIYLQGKASYGAREFIGFDGTATGIANVDVNTNDNFDANAPMYNLAGQRVTKSYKGVVIVNGKKMLNK